MNIEEIGKLIGNTPMIKIKYKYEDKVSDLYAKLEYYNLTGSIKDRIAYYIIKKAIEKNKLKINMPIVEATSGNTGIALAAICTALNYPIHIFMPNIVSKERIDLLKMYGAIVHITPNGYKESIKRADEFAKEVQGFRPNQFENYDNVLAHYEMTGKEIFEKLQDVSGFVSGIGSGGTIMGVAKYLKEKNNNIKIYALEPDKLPILSGMQEEFIAKEHKIAGIGDDFIPNIVDKSEIDDIILINDDDAVNMSRKLAKNLGLGVGISSGANFLGCVLKNKKNKIVTVFADDNKKYLSTDLSKDIEANENYISNKIELIEYQYI